MIRTTLLALTSALAATAAACGDEACHEGHCHVDPDADPGAPDAGTTVVEETRVLVQHQTDEAIFVAGPGDSVVLTLTADAANLDWNLHGHGGGFEGTIVEEFGVDSVSYTFDPPADTDWFLLIRNLAAPDLTVDVRLELTGATFTEWEE